MRSSCLSITWVLALALTVNAYAQEEVAGPATPVVTETETPPPPVERPRPAEKPRIEKPKPIEKPRPDPEISGSPSNPATIKPKPVETAAPVVVPVSSPMAPPAPPAIVRDSASLSCLALAFAMLILGVAVGFLGRHLLSRHKLGGMTVRIGTWRGIP